MTRIVRKVSAMGRQTRQAGYTLIEMVIVASILGISAAMVIPTLGATDVSRLKGAAEVLAADLSAAQVESIAHGDDIRLMLFDTENDTYYIAATSDTDTPITNPIGNAAYQVVFGQGSATQFKGVTIQSVSVGGDDMLGFGVYGELDQTTAATITLANNGKTITLSVEPYSGEVSIGEVE